MKKLLLILLWAPLASFAQEISNDSLEITYENGKAFIFHEVSEGETLYGLQRKYGTPVESIRLLNKLDSDDLKPGTTLKIPYSGTAAMDTTASASQEQELIIPSPQHANEYQVQPGDNLYQISLKHKVTVDQLKGWNNLDNDVVKVGQKLLVYTNTPTGIKPVNEADKKPVKEEKETVVTVAREEGSVVPVETAKTESEPAMDNSKLAAVQDRPSFVSPDASFLLDTDPESGKKIWKIREFRDFKKGTFKEADQVQFVALYEGAPKGAVLQISDPALKKSVFVKVIGKGPVNEGIPVIYLSRHAIEMLGMDSPSQVEIRYTIPAE